MRRDPSIAFAGLVAVGLAALAWLGYRQPEMGFALFGWTVLCI